MEVKDGRETMFGIRIALSDVSMTIIFMVLSLDYDFLLYMWYLYISYIILLQISEYHSLKKSNSSKKMKK